MVKFPNLNRLLQIGLGVVVTVGILWLSLTHGTGTLVGPNYDSPTVNLSNYDGDGQPKKLAYKVNPKRVLVTYPGATELLLELGLGDHIVGSLKPYGPEPDSLKAAYEALPLFEAPFVPSREEVLAASPDLIMAWGHHFQPNALGSIQQWQAEGVATYVVPATVRQGAPTLESTLYPFIDDVGRIFGIAPRAEAYKQSLEKRVQAVVNQTQADSQRPSVLILQSYGNSSYSIYGQAYVIHDVVEKAGGRNLNDQRLASVGPERVLGFDPDYIVLVVAGIQDMSSLPNAVKALQADPNLASMRAIREGHIIPVEFSQVNNGNDRLVDALEMIYRGLH